MWAWNKYTNTTQHYYIGCLFDVALLAIQTTHTIAMFQWNIPTPVYVVYRLLTAAWCTGSLLYLTIPTIGQHDPHNIMAFLTTWTYLALTIYYASAFMSLVIHLVSTCYSSSSLSMKKQSQTDSIRKDSEVRTDLWSTEDSERQQLTLSDRNAVSDDNSGILDAIHYKSRDKITWHMKMTWVFANVIYVSAPLVTIVYYVMLYTVEANNFMDFNIHLINSLLVLIDTCIVARPVRLLHVFHPLLYGLAYMVFSVIYWSEDKVNNVLYEDVLDFNRPWRTVIAVLVIGLLVVPVVHLCQFGIYRLRLRISATCCSFRHAYDDI